MVVKLNFWQLNVLRFNVPYILREVAESEKEACAIFHHRKTEGFY